MVIETRPVINTDLHNINRLLYESTISEPERYDQLVVALKDYFVLDVSNWVGQGDDPASILQAVVILQRDKVKAVGKFVRGRVGGIIFNPFDAPTTMEVKRIKSEGGQQARQDLFSLVCPLTTAENLVDHELLGNIAYQNLAGDCFMLMPVKSGVINRLPQTSQYWSDFNGVKFINFFIPVPDSHFDNLIQVATTVDQPFMAGTSANYTGLGSLTNRLSVATFVLANGLYHLDEEGDPDPSKRKSFSIERLMGGKMIPFRDGNEQHEVLAAKADAQLELA